MVRPRPGCRALALLLVGARQAWAQIRVMSPRSLVSSLGDHGRIVGSTATFGAPYFGQRVLGKLVYVEDHATAPHCTKDYALDFCAESTQQAAQDGLAEGEAKLINIFVIRRGGCSFVTKVKVAAAKCAHAAIIVDRADSNLTAEDLKHIVVADDGYGGSVEIPSVLISRVQGQKLIDALKDEESIVAELAWDIPTDRVVNVDMWISSASRESLRFLKEFSPKRRVLNSVMSFTPHYAIFMMDKGDPALFNDLCVQDGQYCAEDPDGAGPVTGTDVIAEDVRQLCIHELYKKVSNEGRVQFSREFWDYMEQLGDACPVDGTGENMFGYKCSVNLMRKIGINSDDVNECASRTTGDKLKDQRDHPAWSPRAVRINGWRYTGMLDPDLVTRAICSGFITAPDECDKLLNPRDPFGVLHPMGLKGGVTFGQMVGWMVVTLLVAFGALLLYKRYLKNEMRITLREEVMLEVRSAMGEYRQMQG
ncbi:unnamed protein product [Prorocentrum cordatum]|uniref:PA domain-containing protein n=1 Tax=Prorocentrum cordatum TaxID=2364126 RepID=A0ABN9VN85_9DINO|nr:unnamed protein product [Polarella glacialis]